MLQTVFITGATSGIGEACAYIFAENKFNLIITGRRKARLETLAEQLREKHDSKVLTLCFDVRDRNETARSIENLPAVWQDVDVLINNAGLSLGLDPIDKGDPDDWETMIDTNIKGLLFVTRMIVPGMVKRNRGHIINIGSIAGKEVYLKGNVYCATKFAVEALTRAMRMDLLHAGIKVTQVAPGAVNTEFSTVRFHGNTENARQVYTGFDPLSARDVAEVVWFAVSRPAHVNIGDVILLPAAQANASQFFRKTE